MNFDVTATPIATSISYVNNTASVTIGTSSTSSTPYPSNLCATQYVYNDHICLTKQANDTTKNENVDDKNSKENKMRFEEGRIYSNNAYIMPDIKNIKILGQTPIFDGSIEARVIIVEFADKTSEKAVVEKGDIFNFEQGISICLTKKLLSMRAKGSNQSSTAIYNKIISHAVKVFDKNVKDSFAEYEKKLAEEKRRQKKAEKRAMRKAQREAAERERQIEIQKEAYVRAMMELKNNG